MQSSISSNGALRTLIAGAFAIIAVMAALPALAEEATPAAQATHARHWRGELVYFADSASFTDCATGQRWPVAAQGDFLALQRSYLKWRRAPKAPLLVRFEGRIETLPAMEGPPRAQMVVDRFGSAQPGRRCPKPPRGTPAAPGMPAAR